MQKKKTGIVDGYPETRARLNFFKSSQNLVNKKLKTLEDAVNFAIDEAERVPELEKKIMELETENKRLRRNNEPYRPEDDPYTQG